MEKEEGKEEGEEEEEEEKKNFLLEYPSIFLLGILLQLNDYSFPWKQTYS